MAATQKKPRPRIRSKMLARVRTTSKQLGPKLGHVRDVRGHSLREVSRLTDGAIDPTNLSRLEALGRQDPRVSTLLCLCVCYEMDVTLTRTGEIRIAGTRLNMGPIRVKEEA